MKNLRIKLILIIILIAAISAGVLFLHQWLEKEKQLAILKESFRHCQNLENINVTLNPEYPSINITGTPIMDPDIPPMEYVIWTGDSLDCLGAHDIYFCNLMSSEKEQTFCENSFYAFKALKENNLDYCEKAGEIKFLCLAIFKKDESFCEKISPSLFVGETAKTYCRAVVKEDIKECESLGDEVMIQECRDSFYTTLAFLKQDTKFCDKISVKRRSELHCKAVLDLNECLKYHSEVKCPEIYLPRIAEVSKDPSICEEIPYKEDDGKGMFFYQACVSNAQ